MPTDLAKEIAKHVSSAFGGAKAKVWEHRDESEQYAVDVLSCADAPQKGYTSYSTVTMHEAPVDVGATAVMTELAAVAATEVEQFELLASTAAFYVIKDGWIAVPGAVLRNVVRDLGISETLPHLCLFAPFAWEPALTRFETSTGETIHWLLAVAISEGELRLLDEAGFDALDDLFAEQEMPYYDVEREPVV